MLLRAYGWFIGRNLPAPSQPPNAALLGVGAGLAGTEVSARVPQPCRSAPSCLPADRLVNY
eukprot:11206029-Lingulodinium_polyedra.AAC.1